jgi:hypothetical protein
MDWHGSRTKHAPAQITQIQGDPQEQKAGDRAQRDRPSTCRRPGCGRLSFYPLHRSNQTVSAARDCLNDLGIFCVVLEGFAEFRDAARKNIVGYEGVRPHRPNQPFFWNYLVGVLGQVDQHLHGLGLDVFRRSVGLQDVHLRLDEPFADAEIALHVRAPNDQQASADYSSPLQHRPTDQFARKQFCSGSRKPCA